LISTAFISAAREVLDRADAPHDLEEPSLLGNEHRVSGLTALLPPIQELHFAPAWDQEIWLTVQAGLIPKVENAAFPQG